ncbi:hypothetical protein DL765_011668 [Monosporascus sp. GIB2]|nr:hypothetical protein DL765_011668 [Monosporascus sp. GIB2]
MAEYFLQEYQTHSRDKTLEDRNLYLGGTIVTAVVAGSDTSRAALIASCWYLAKYPEHASKIEDETRNVDLNDPTTLATLPHLNGFINETLRLVPPIMMGTSRLTGPEGLMLGNVLIPPYTRVTAPRYVILRTLIPSVSGIGLPAAGYFIPERWYSRPELICDKRAFAPFSVGGRQCVGRAVAFTELRCVTTLLPRDYDIEFAPGLRSDDYVARYERPGDRAARAGAMSFQAPRGLDVETGDARHSTWGVRGGTMLRPGLRKMGRPSNPPTNIASVNQ